MIERDGIRLTCTGLRPTYPLRAGTMVGSVSRRHLSRAGKPVGGRLLKIMKSQSCTLRRYELREMAFDLSKLWFKSRGVA